MIGQVNTGRYFVSISDSQGGDSKGSKDSKAGIAFQEWLCCLYREVHSFSGPSDAALSDWGVTP